MWIGWMLHQKLEKRAEWATLASEARSAHCSLSRVISTLSTLYRNYIVHPSLFLHKCTFRKPARTKS